MPEFSIIIERKDINLSLMIWNKLERILDNLKCVSIENNKEYIEIAMIIPRKNNKLLLSAVKNIISDCITLFYKEKFLEKHLNFNSCDEFTKRNLIKALSVFDKNLDKLNVMTKLNIKNKLYVSSFYIFRLKELQTKWQEITDMMQENINVLSITNSYNELIKYLINSNEPEIDSIFIYQDNNKVIIRDKIGNNLLSPIEIGENYECEIIPAMISLSPEKIYIKYNINSNVELTNKISNLFCNKLNY